MPSINYLAVVSPLSPDKKKINFSVEIVEDEFVRAAPGVVSEHRGVGHLCNFVMDESETAPELLPNIFRAYIVSTALKPFLANRMLTVHAESIRSLGDVNSSLRALLSHPSPRVWFAIDARYFSTGEVTDRYGRNKDGIFVKQHNTGQRYFHRSPDRDGKRVYRTFVRRDFFGDLLECGSIDLDTTDLQDEFILRCAQCGETSGYAALAEVTLQYPDAFIHVADKVLGIAPDPWRLQAVSHFIAAICATKCRETLDASLVYSSYSGRVHTAVLHALENSSELDVFLAAMTLTKNGAFWSRDQSTVRSLLSGRLTAATPREILRCLIDELVVTNHLNDDAPDEVLKKLVDTVAAEAPDKLELDAATQLLLFLKYCYSLAGQQLASDRQTSYAYSHEHRRIHQLLDARTLGAAQRVTRIIETAVEKGQYRLTLHLLNASLPDLLSGPTGLRLAELYLQSLLSLPCAERPAIEKLVEALPVFRHNVQILSKRFDLAIADGNTGLAQTLLDRLVSLDPLAEITQLSMQQLQRRKTVDALMESAINVETLNGLSGVDFELLLQDKFKSFGFTVANTPTTGDFGADILLDDREGTRYVIQCKRFNAKVNLKAVQEVVAALSHYSGDYGIVITNGAFLPSAVKLAQSNGIELWDGDRLIRFLSGDVSFSAVRDAVNAR